MLIALSVTLVQGLKIGLLALVYAFRWPYLFARDKDFVKGEERGQQNLQRSLLGKISGGLAK